MNPTQEAIGAIRAHVALLAGGWAGNTDAQVVAEANTPAVANPAAQATVAKPYGFADLLGALSQPSAANVAAFPGIAALFDDILARNTPRVAAAIRLMTASARITSDEAAAMLATLSATEPDPSYAAQIGWAQAELGRPLDADDALKARP